MFKPDTDSEEEEVNFKPHPHGSSGLVLCEPGCQNSFFGDSLMDFRVKAQIYVVTLMLISVMS